MRLTFASGVTKSGAFFKSISSITGKNLKISSFASSVKLTNNSQSVAISALQIVLNLLKPDLIFLTVFSTK